MFQRLETFHANCSQEKDVMRFDGYCFQIQQNKLT